MKAGVRLSGGALRGRGLTVPPGARPTEGRVREALFSIWRERLAGATVLDLFAGSGAVGLEAAGRGALAAVLVDGDPRAVRTIEANVAQVRPALLGAVVEVRRLVLPAGLGRLTGPFDLVYAAPPYRFDAHDARLAGVAPLLGRDGEVAIEHDARSDLPLTEGPLVRVDARRYGESAVSFYRRG
ncbi:MAG TPA: RsmD family RNA methyltransferase [Thermoanaerobaculia bacterium]